MSDVIGHYKLLEQIGTGGLGDVYRARDTKLGRTVAIKFPPPSLTADPVRREALLRQARNVARLSHPSIATLFDVGEDGDRIYLVFEYIAGEALAAMIGGHPLKPRRAVEIGVQLADGLAEAHAEGLAHGHVRPDTIFVTAKDRAKLLDFGLSDFTRGGAARASAGGDSADSRVASDVDDIFALGCVLYEMLTGRQAFRKPTVQTPPAPSTFNRAVPAELDAIVARALARDPEARYRSAATLSAELRGVGAILDVRTAAIEAEFLEDTPVGARRATPWLITLIVIACVAAGLWTWRDDVQSAWRRWFGSPPPAVLVVMPFEVGGTMPAVVADGIAEDLMTRLGTMGVRVVGRSSLRARRGRELQTVARDVGAAVVLTGTIRGDGDQIVLATTLVEAGTGVKLWSGTFPSSKPQVLATAASLAETVVTTLGLTVASSDAQARALSRVVNAAAYDRYLEGRDAEARGDFGAAIKLYEQAIADDRSLAEAHAALATASYHELLRSARLDDADAWRQLRRSADSAIAADPDLSDANLAAALAAPTMSEVVVWMRRAIERDPSRGQLYGELAGQVSDIAPEHAIRLYRTSLALDPGRIDTVEALGRLHINLNQMAQADEQIASGRRLNPSTTIWNSIQGYRDLMKGQPAAALGSLQPALSAADPAGWLLHVRAMADSDRLAEAHVQAARLVAEHPDFCEARAVLAGLSLDTNRGLEAREEIGRILRGAVTADAAPGRARCAAVAAAAGDDARAAAAWLRRIANTPPLFRVWVLQLAGVSGQTAMVRNWYPWRKVTTDPEVVKGKQTLEAAYIRLRDEISPLLPTAEEFLAASR